MWPVTSEHGGKVDRGPLLDSMQYELNHGVSMYVVYN
jgi:hypothetical protein